eukprot:3696125-Pyramimonas_sp.AAC.1
MAKTPNMDAAVATEKGVGVAPGTAGSADSKKHSLIDEGGFKKCPQRRKSREDKDMMAMFEITDIESD